MFCPNCGAQAPNDAKFCSACGKPIAPVQYANASPQTAAAPASPVFSSGPIAGSPPLRSGFAGWLAALKLWQKIALGAVTFIVVVVALAMWATSGLEEPVQRHFAAIRSGDVVGAYGELSVAARQQTSLDDFRKMLINVPALTKVTGESYSSREVNNGEGHLDGMLEIEGGGKLPIQVRLVKENGAWKILAYQTGHPRAE